MATPENKDILELLGIVFSTVFISGMNIVLSGHLLGYVFSLDDRGSNRFTLKVPYILELKIKGDRVIAGFAAFSISLLFVGFFLSDIANTIFMDNLKATENAWTACQALATSISLSVCLISGGIKFFVIGVKFASSSSIEGNPDERVQKLISK
jgi:hypothetical protein